MIIERKEANKMNILVLMGSPRKNGNTAFLVKGFKEGAESKKHKVEVIDVGSLNITPCKACEYCHGKGKGKCCQKDDMQKLYKKLENADMIVFATAIHYWNFTGQMQNLITRMYYKGVMPCKKYALIMSSGSNGVYKGITQIYKDILDYFGAKDMGIKKFNGMQQQTDNNYKAMVNFGASIK